MSDDDSSGPNDYTRGYAGFQGGLGPDYSSPSYMNGWNNAAEEQASRPSVQNPSPEVQMLAKPLGEAAGAGGVGCLLASFLLSVIAIVIPVAVLAVPGALAAAWPLVVLGSRKGPRLRFARAWKLAFRALTLYGGVSLWITLSALCATRYWSLGSLNWLAWLVLDSLATAIRAVTPLPVATPIPEPARPETTALVLALSVLQVPGLLASGRTLQKRMSVAFGDGFWGFLRAAGVAVVVLPVCMALSGLLLAFLFRWAQVASFKTLHQFLSIGGVTCCLCVAYALLGGILLASTASLVLRTRKDSRRPGIRVGFIATFEGLLCFALSTALAMLLFRQADPLLRWAFAVVQGNEATGLELVMLWTSLWEGILLLVPGLLLAGTIVAGRMSRTFQGGLAYVGIFVGTGALALLSLPPALLGAAYLLTVKSGFIAGL